MVLDYNPVFTSFYLCFNTLDVRELHIKQIRAVIYIIDYFLLAKYSMTQSITLPLTTTSIDNCSGELKNNIFNCIQTVIDEGTSDHRIPPRSFLKNRYRHAEMLSVGMMTIVLVLSIISLAIPL